MLFPPIPAEMSGRGRRIQEDKTIDTCQTAVDSASVVSDMKRKSTETICADKKPGSYLWCRVSFAKCQMRAVRLRQDWRPKLRDAIVCDTAQRRDLKLSINDTRLPTVLGLVCRSVSFA